MEKLILILLDCYVVADWPFSLDLDVDEIGSPVMGNGLVGPN